MNTVRLQKIIDEGWNNRSLLSKQDNSSLKEATAKVLELIDQGKLRIAEKQKEQWVINSWAKKAVLLSFRLTANKAVLSYPGTYDKVPLKFADWNEHHFKNSGVRAVPGSIVRRGSYVASDVVLMPSFVNIGAFIDQGTLIDTWATVGSCAQVGKSCHISGGVGLGGVLEPLQANPVIIEDQCFIGARSEIVEGVIVEQGAVIGMGVFLGASTPIINRKTGDVYYGRVPPYSVVISGTMPGKPLPNGSPGPGLSCAVIVKQVDAKTRSKTAINELLRP